MKSAKKLAAIAASAFISACFIVGCGKYVSGSMGDIIQDMDVYPTQKAAYEDDSRRALEEYFEIANKYTDKNGDLDLDDKNIKAAVTPAAISAATRLFAYACYNERELNQYMYFSAQEGDTDLGSSGSATALRQEYYLRVNEQEGVTPGYRYHYTIKKVKRSDGLVGSFTSAFESARTRITIDTDKLYRLEGTDIEIGPRNDILDEEILECKWKKGNDWGKSDIVIRKNSHIEPEDIRADIEQYAEDDNHTIRANINILADNIVKDAVIIKNESEENGLEGYLITMTIDTSVANDDAASVAMLCKANGSSDCRWKDEKGEDGETDSGLSIVFRIWSNGLFRFYSVTERWKGTISGFSGVAESMTAYYYSYSDRDCDFGVHYEWLKENFDFDDVGSGAGQE